MVPRRPRALSITLVSDHAEPAIEAYLHHAGVASHTTRSLERLADMVPPSASAVVVFADAFPLEAVVSALGAVHACRPEVLAVIVTSAPSALMTLPESRQWLVLPKPVWGWTIVDAIRARTS